MTPEQNAAAFKAYLQECDECAIVPDVAGAFNAGVRASLAQPASPTHMTPLFSTRKALAEKHGFSLSPQVNALIFDVADWAQRAQPASVPDLYERLAEAHDASLDDDHRACRVILTEAMSLLAAAPAAPQPAQAAPDDRDLLTIAYFEGAHEAKRQLAKVATQPAQADMAPEYAAAVRELAEQSGMSEAQVLRAAVRLYQAEQKGLVTVEHKEQIGPLAAPQPEAQPQWQPIETAPKDFVTEFDGWNGERVPNVIWAHPESAPKGEYAWCIAEYVSGFGYENVRVKGLTHWMPIPAAPSAQAEQEASGCNVPAQGSGQ